VKPKNSRNSGGASSHTPPSLAARGPHKTPENQGSVTASSPLPFPAGGEGLHHLQKNKTPKPVDFNFFFLFRICFGLLLFRSASLLIFLLFTSSSPSLQVASSWAALQCAEGGGESVARGSSVEIPSPGGSSGGWACCWCQPDEGGRRFGLWGRIGCWFL